MTKEEFLAKLSTDNEFKKRLFANPREVLKELPLDADEKADIYRLITTPGATEDCKASCTLDCRNTVGSKSGSIAGTIYP